MDWVIDAYTAESMLMQYSEWLDISDVMAPSPDDPRTHEELVREFIAQRNRVARPKVLAS
jgi:hypothetical protein